MNRLEVKCPVLMSPTGLQIWLIHVVVSQRTSNNCIKMKNARAGRAARAEIIVFAH